MYRTTQILEAEVAVLKERLLKVDGLNHQSIAMPPLSFYAIAF